MKNDVKKNLMILGNMFVAATVIYSVVRIVQSSPPPQPKK